MRIKVFYIFTALLIILGCGQSLQRSYTAPDYNPSAMKKIVVAPFQNLTSYPHAGVIISDLIASEFIRRGGILIVKRDKVERYLTELKMENEIIDRSLATEIGRALKADVVLFGSVSQFWYQETKDRYPDWEPTVAVNARLVDVDSEEVVWATSTSRCGSAAFTYLLHDSKEALQNVAQATVKELCSSLMGH